jgi:hypothetical protein
VFVEVARPEKRLGTRSSTLTNSTDQSRIQRNPQFVRPASRWRAKAKYNRVSENYLLQIAQSLWYVACILVFGRWGQ